MRREVSVQPRCLKASLSMACAVRRCIGTVPELCRDGNNGRFEAIVSVMLGGANYTSSSMAFLPSAVDWNRTAYLATLYDGFSDRADH